MPPSSWASSASAAEARNAGDYVAAIYDRMDACLASGAQWNYSPRWNERDKDGWNGEDFSILDSSASVRPNFRPRPYPRHTAGLPLAFRFDDGRSGSATLASSSPGTIAPSSVTPRSACHHRSFRLDHASWPRTPESSAGETMLATYFSAAPIGQ